MNQADSLEFEEDLIEAGARPADGDDADLVVVNTCSVTASADQGARQTIRRIARVNPAAKIVVTGCYATRCPDEVGALPNVIRVVRNPDKLALVGAVLGSEEELLTTAERFGSGDTFEDAIARAYAGVEQISFDGMQYRRDIGRKALTTARR